MDVKELKIIFMGTPEFSEIILDKLIENKYNIISVFTQSDKKIGRKQKLQKSPVKLLAEKNSIPVFTPEKIRPEIENIRTQNPDLILVAAYGKIIPQEILDIPNFKCINIHPSLLPKYRGASPLQNTLLNGESKTGTTVMLMSQEIDAGDILAQEETTIDPNEKLPEFSEKLARISAELLVKTLPEWINGKLTLQRQNDSDATFCQMLKKEDGQIDWNESAEKIYNRYRAFYPWPGIFTFWNGKRIKLNRISQKNNLEITQKIGEVFQKENFIAIQTKNGIIILDEIQIEGKPNTKAGDFLNGHPDFIGSILN